MTPQFSVVVCTRNRANILADCLASIVGQDLADGLFELVVVDDGSFDETATIVRRVGAETSIAVRYVQQPPSGLNVARNAGVGAAAGAFITFLDDDEIAPPNYLRKTRELFIQSPHAAGVGGPCLDRVERGPRTCSKCSLGAVDVAGKGIRQTDVLLGGNMTIRKHVFAEVGPFEDSLSGRGDETEWFHRAQGQLFIQAPDLWVWHRRDHMTLRTMCLHAYRQGFSLPESRSLVGASFKPRYARMARSLGHATLRACSRGLVLFFRELGAARAYFRGAGRTGAVAQDVRDD